MPIGISKPDPAGRVSERSMRGYRSAALVGLLVLAFCIVPLIATWAFADERENILAKSGIRYPDGYDVNTVGEVRGRVTGFIKASKGPVMFTLATPGETYTVIASPSWFWNDSKIKVAEGDQIRVVGSKTLGKDGNLYIVAQRLYMQGSKEGIAIRDRDGTCMWRTGGMSYGMHGGASGTGMGMGGAGGHMGGAMHGGHR